MDEIARNLAPPAAILLLALACRIYARRIAGQAARAREAREASGPTARPAE